MKLASGRFPLDQQYSVDGGHILGHPHGDSPAGQTPHSIDDFDSIGHLALRLMAELSACLQMITSDIAHSADLDAARARWLQHLMALVALIERANAMYVTELDRPHVEVHSALPEPADTHPPRLTAREREVMALTKKGYPPRRIARHLQLSVKTVYTHLRNIRQKQRLLHPHKPD